MGWSSPSLPQASELISKTRYGIILCLLRCRCYLREKLLMFRRLMVAILVLTATTFSTAHISRADCGPGNDNNGTGDVSNTIDNSGTCLNISGAQNNSTGTQTNTINNSGAVGPFPDG